MSSAQHIPNAQLRASTIEPYFTENSQRSTKLLSPIDHASLIHPDQRGHVIIWTNGKRRKKNWHSVKPADLEPLLAKWAGRKNIYITPNEFYGWRRMCLLKKLKSLYLDIDCHDMTDTPVDMAKMASIALDRITALHWPEPNMIIYTGRGIHLYWLHTSQNRDVLPRWQQAQKELVQQLRGDNRACDACRVLRLTGTKHSNGHFVTGELLSKEPYDFDWLIDQILPVKREIIRSRKKKKTEIRDIRAQRALNRKSEKKKNQKTIYDWWYHVYCDLWTIIKHHWENNQIPIGSGCRENLLFHLANALSWFTQSDALESEIHHVAKIVLPSYTSDEVKTFTSSVLNRAKKSANGEKVIFHGKEWDPRYHYTKIGIINDLAELFIDELIPLMKGLVPDEVQAQRRILQKRAKRRAAGGISREEYLLSHSDRREKPWEDLNISRATYYRRKAKSNTI